MIRRLVLENWRSHEHTELVFGRGTNVLIGIMGAGKSSAMNAVSFALFGTFPELAAKKIRLDDVVMNRPSAKNGAKVCLEFQVDGTDYAVKREIRVGKGTVRAELWAGDRLLEGPQSKRVDEKIGEILKLDYDLFSRAVYSEQNNIDYFLEIPKGQRRQKIDELLRIDRFENARKSLGTVITRLLDKSKEYAVVEAPAAEKLEELRREAENTRLRVEETLAEKTAAEKLLAEARRAYGEFLIKKPAFETLDAEIREKRGRLEALRERLQEFGKVTQDKRETEEGLKRLEEEKTEAKKTENERLRLERELEKTRGLVEKGEAGVRELEEKVRALKADERVLEKRVELKKVLKQKAEEAEEIMRTHAECLARVSEDAESIEKLRTCGEKCPVCEMPLPDEKRLKLLAEKECRKTERQEAVERLAAHVASLKKSGGQAEAELETLEKEVEKLEQARWLRERVEEQSAETAELRKRLKQLQAGLEGLKPARALEEILGEQEKVLRTLEFFKLSDLYEKTVGEVVGLEKDLALLNYDERLEKECFERLKNAEKQAELKTQEAEGLRQILEEKKKRLAELESREAERQARLRQAEALKKNADSLFVLQENLRRVQSLLRQEFTSAVNAGLTEVWRSLYPYADYVNLRLAVDEQADYVLQLQGRDGAWLNVEGIMSGGERSTACIALRVAFALVLTQNLSWLVLDEPTHNLDRQAIRELAKTLREYLPKLVEQAFVITHEEELEHASTGCVYKFERDKQYDEPTRIAMQTQTVFF